MIEIITLLSHNTANCLPVFRKSKYCPILVETFQFSASCKEFVICPSRTDQQKKRTVGPRFSLLIVVVTDILTCYYIVFLTSYVLSEKNLQKMIESF